MKYYEEVELLATEKERERKNKLFLKRKEELVDEYGDKVSNITLTGNNKVKFLIEGDYTYTLTNIQGLK